MEQLVGFNAQGLEFSNQEQGSSVLIQEGLHRLYLENLIQKRGLPHTVDQLLAIEANNEPLPQASNPPMAYNGDLIGL